jgi:beta-phosphoglucomutase-like phosphatase (HAD superfamily)
VTDRLESVIFDHSVLLQEDGPTLQQLRTLLTQLKSLGVQITVFSTHPMNIDRQLERRSLPLADLYLTKYDVGKNKGSHEWVEEAARRLGIKRHQFLYVGDGELDWRTAINSPSFTCMLAGPDRSRQGRRLSLPQTRRGC